MHDPNLTAFLIIAIAIVTLIVGLIAARLCCARQNRELQKLKEQLLARPGYQSVDDHWIRGQRGDPSIPISVGVTSKLPASIEIRVAALGLPECTLTTERGLHRFVKSIGLTKEVQIGAPAFDGRVFIFTRPSDEPRVRELLGNENVRKHVLDLFRSGVRHVVMTERGLVIHRLRPRIEPLTAELVERDLDSAIAIQRAGNGAVLAESSVAPESKMGGVLGYVDLLKGRFVVVVLALVTLGAFSIIAGSWIYPTLDEEQLFFHGLQVSIAAWFVGSLVAFPIIRGRSYSHILFLTFTIGSMIACVLIFNGVLRVVNAELDSSEARRIETTVENRIQRQSRTSTYYLVVPSWRKERSTETLRVHQKIFERSPTGSRLILYVKPGRLGYPWIELFEAAPGSP